MKIKKVLSALLIGASMTAMAQSAFAETKPAVPAASAQIQSEGQISSQAAQGQMWFYYNNLTSQSGAQTTINYAKYTAYSGLYVNFTVNQTAVDGAGSPTIFYTVIKENNNTWNGPAFTLTGQTSRTVPVYLEPGTYFVIFENRSPVPANINGTLG
ncbi:hypothetical protein [Paenibacillus hamazuiensis]|uniref:hypothetical protein n=1 Tax=Paenibacillus hamazuiensis TaxID=2936508 RepID=UPI00200F7708|nr:hypothetical protein [Paenibacillus hamazuiensis]